jgi:hypothetical protein
MVIVMATIRGVILQVRGHRRTARTDRSDAILTASNCTVDACVRSPKDESLTGLPKFDGRKCAQWEENSLPKAAAVNYLLDDLMERGSEPREAR